MKNVRTCGRYGCEHYYHNLFSDNALPNGTCKYNKEITVHPGDNCKFGLLEKTASAPSSPSCTEDKNFSRDLAAAEKGNKTPSLLAVIGIDKVPFAP